MGKKLYVGNLTYRTNSSDLEQLFSQYGTVQSAEVISDRETGRSKGFGFVEMTTEAEAKAAIEALHEHEVDGRRLTVNEARPREPRPGGGGGWRGGSGGGGGRDGGYDSRPLRKPAKLPSSRFSSAAAASGLSTASIVFRCASRGPKRSTKSLSEKSPSSKFSWLSST